MSNWANKYRPKTIEEVVGQPKIKREIETLNRVDKLPKVILLSGSSGSGKTTMALLIAKLGKCQNLSEDGKPCGVCSSCANMDKFIEKGINTVGSEVSMYNISKLNKSEDADEIIMSMEKGNSFVNHKRFFILDEMQVASQQAQSRFLKVLENLPKNVFVILCTTNPEKLIEPLQTRCVKYVFTRPKSSDIVERLANICVAEGQDYTRTGLSLVVKYSNRTMRTAINKIEELSAYGEIDKQSVEQHVGTISDSFYYEYLKNIKTNNLSRVSANYQELEENERTFQDFVGGFASFITDMIDISNLIYPEIYTPDEIKRYKRFLEGFNELQLVGILKKIREFLKETKDDKFIYYSFSTELMSVLDSPVSVTVQTNQQEIEPVPETVVNQRYAEISREIQQQESEEITDKELSADDLLSKFVGDEVILPE